MAVVFFLKRVSFFIFLVGFYGFSDGQTRPLAKGREVPDVDIVFHIGDSLFSGHLSDYRNKLIILDFWGTSCQSCILDMPRMLELQKKFGDRIKVILVTPNSEDEVKHLITKTLISAFPKEIRYAAMHLPIIVDDTIFRVLFPFSAIPRHVWIDGTQKFRAITYDNTTTDENVEAILEGRQAKLAEVYVDTTYVDIDHPWLWSDEGNEESRDKGAFQQRYSFFSKRLLNYSVDFGREGIQRDGLTKKIVGLSLINQPILQLYQAAMGIDAVGDVLNYYSANNMFFDVSDLNRYIRPDQFGSDWFHWADSNTYCYAIRVPLSQSLELRDVMLDDLDRFFHLKSGLEKRFVRCYILKRTSSKEISPSVYSTPRVYVRINEQNISNVVVEDGNISQVIIGIGETGFQTGRDQFVPMIDETHYMGRIDLKLPFSSYHGRITLKNIREELERYGLDLVEEYRLRDVFVIKEDFNNEQDRTTRLTKE